MENKIIRLQTLYEMNATSQNKILELCVGPDEI